MRCPRCGHENPEEARFCGNCGAALFPTAARQITCPNCGRANPLESHTCGFCFADLPAIAPAGFWMRLCATFIDALAILAIVIAISEGSDATRIYGSGPLLDLVVGSLILISPLLYYWLFTGLRGQTLGKMALGIKVVDAEGRIPGLGWALVRESLGKFLSFIALFFGFLWVAWDSEKRGWHDHLAGTYVIHSKAR